jgi:hypothetical protein
MSKSCSEIEGKEKVWDVAFFLKSSRVAAVPGGLVSVAW